jgi:hypothetical protein
MSRSEAVIIDLEDFRRRRERERTPRPETVSATPPVVWVPVWWYWMPPGGA